MGWYKFAIMALFFMGTQRFLYKVSAERKCDTAWTTLAFMATVAVLSSILFLVLKEPVLNVTLILLIALINSGTFLVGTITHIEALKQMPAAAVYPIIRLNVVIVVIFSVMYFKDRFTLYQGIGILCAVAVIIILTRQADNGRAYYGKLNRGFVLVVVSLLSGSVASISSKFAAMYVNKIGFMALSYIMACGYALGLRKKLKSAESNPDHKEALIIGIAMGLINFAGYFSFLKALSMGPLSLIVSITGMHFAIAIILATIIYKEKMTRLRIGGILLTMTSIILLRL
ncbi:EamA family transporter [Thermodesulfobacteriota bacterium]